MRRGVGALVLGVVVALVLPGIPILAFLLTTNHASWTAKTWVAVLIPNIVLLAFVGVVAAGLYLFATRGRATNK